jgi:hypothetical protein
VLCLVEMTCGEAGLHPQPWRKCEINLGGWGGQLEAGHRGDAAGGRKPKAPLLGGPEWTVTGQVGTISPKLVRLVINNVGKELKSARHSF